MRTNRDRILEYLEKTEREHKENYRGSTTQEMEEALGMKRCNISTQLNRMTEEGILKKSGTRPVYYRLKTADAQDEHLSFRALVGKDGSLKNAVQLAKAAVLYPERPLHILLTGVAGTGKTSFGKEIFAFCEEIKRFSADVKWKEINCQYYRENETGLLQELETSSGKHLLLNHLQVLNHNHQVAIFRYFQEKEQLAERMIVCAADVENPTELPEIVTEWFPVQIGIPRLAERGFRERFQLISSFFMEEAEKMGRTIKLNSELLYCLMLYPCAGELRQLGNDIRVGCANAYVREFQSSVQELHAYIYDFPIQIRNGLLKWKQFHEQIEEIIPRDYSYAYSATALNRLAAVKGKEEKNIYTLIEKKEKELRKQGMEEEEINELINDELTDTLKELQSIYGEKKLDRESLAKIVDSRITSMVDQFLMYAGGKTGKAYPDATFYGICLHLSAFLEKTGDPRRISEETLVETMEGYKDEYRLCLEFAEKIEKEFQVPVPIEETVILTMFLGTKDREEQEKKRPVVLIAMHGSSAASSICSVVNALSVNRNTYAFDFPLDMSTEQAYHLFVKKIQEIHGENGILLLHDTGSIKTIAGLAMQNTGIPIRCIEVPFTLVALECSQKAGMNTDLEEAYRGVLESCQNTLPFMRESYRKLEQDKVILTLCMTGQGGAVQIKKYIEKNAELQDIQIIPLAISDQKFLLGKINAILKEHEIVCMIGTYDPGIYNIPFISVAKLFETPIEKLSLLLSLPETELSAPVDYEAIYEYLQESLPDLDINRLKRHLPRVVARIKKSAGGLNEDQELGMFMHLACSVSRLKAGEVIGTNSRKNQIISGNKKLYTEMVENLKPLEQAFGICYSDDEIASLIEICKRI